MSNAGIRHSAKGWITVGLRTAQIRGKVMERRELFLNAYKIRRVEQRFLELFSKGEISGTIHTCIGQEFSGLAVASALQPDDVIFSNHRCHGHYLARFDDVVGLIGEMLGKPSGICGGFGGSQHLYRPGFFSSGIQGGMGPVAVGTALAFKHLGERKVAVLFIGDGTLGQGVLYEAFNLASILRCPVQFVIEDNAYAQSTQQSETMAGSIEGRAKAFDLRYFAGSTDAPEELMAQARASLDHVRATRQPALLHVKTYRLGPHSKGDDLRAPSEILEAAGRDPLGIFLRERRDDESTLGELRNINQRIETALVLAVGEANAISVRLPAEDECALADDFRTLSVVPDAGGHTKSINSALHLLFAELPDLHLLGEDVRDPYGGAFKVSQGLSTMFGARVINMPISEASIVGMGLGMALRGVPTVCEIMFGDFASLAFDQVLNHVAKIPFMYKEALPASLVLRAPMGSGRGYGCTHSQCLAKYFFGIPNVDVFMLPPRVDAQRFYLEVVRERKSPAIVFEHKLLYGMAARQELPEGYEIAARSSALSMQWIRPLKPVEADVTVVAFGATSLMVEDVAQQLLYDEIAIDLFIPVRISRFDVRPVLSSIQRTGKVVFVEEGTSVGGLGSEFLRKLIERGARQSGAAMPKVGWVAARELPIPAARYLEYQVLPSPEGIRAAILEIFHD